MNIRHAFPSARESAEDLMQLFPGGTIVTIDRCEPRKNSDDEDYWQVYFIELEKPISLNKTNAFAIAQIVKSDEMDDWCGQLVKLMPVPVEVPSKQPGGGKEYVTGFRIFPAKPGDLPTLKPKSSLQRIIEQNRRAALTTGAGLTEKDAAPLGPEKAAVIFVEVEKRNKTWDQLVTHLQGLGMGHLCANRIPPDCSAAVVPFARKFCAGFPAVKDVGPGRVKELIDGWAPPPPPPRKNDVIDRTTGEVMNPAGAAGTDLTEDDIPF